MPMLTADAEAYAIDDVTPLLIPLPHYLLMLLIFLYAY